MSKRELIARELDRPPEQGFDRLLTFLWPLKDAHVKTVVPMLAAESALGKDWLNPEEDSAWGNL